MRMIHLPQSPWLFTTGTDQFTLRIWTTPGMFSEIFLLYSDPYDYLPGAGKVLHQAQTKMSMIARTDEYEIWSCSVDVPTRKLEYQFLVQPKNQETMEQWYGPKGLYFSKDRAGTFRSGYRFNEDRAPSWTGKSVWYQIFPDRFAGGTEQENYIPTTDNFWNGTLEGVINRLPYLEKLGVTGIYLNPVFSSPSNHRYDTLDYLQVDSRLGTNEMLEKLAAELHRRHLRLMLDGVFNHCSWESPFFQDVRRNGDRSQFRDWFIIHDMKATTLERPEQLSSERMKTDPPYECFAFASNMPKWNTDHPDVQEYLIGAAEGWTRRLNLDAWRLDVPDEVSPSFLRFFRRRMRAINPEILIIGEIWTDPSPWNQSGLFDGTMDYPLYNSVSQFMLRGEMNAFEFCREMERRQGMLPLEKQRNQMTFLGNHDLPRCLTIAKGNMERVQAAWIFLCLMDGELNLYYGDERAMQGGEDPANRGAMQWKNTESGQKMESFMSKMNTLRNNLLSVPTIEVKFEALDDKCAKISILRGDSLYILILNPDGIREGDRLFGNGSLILEDENYRFFARRSEGMNKNMKWVVPEVSGIASHLGF